MRKIIRKFFGKKAPQRQHREFARDCILAGEPERLVHVASGLPPGVWTLPAFRREYFVALMMLRQYDVARQFVIDTLAMGAFRTADLLRFIGDLYLLEDKELLQSVTEILLARDLNLGQKLFVLNTAMNHLGENDLHSKVSLGDDTKHRDIHIYRSNVELRRGNFVGQFRAFNRALELAAMVPVLPKDATGNLSVTNIKCAPQKPLCEGPLVSITMSTFNSAETLGPVVESLLAQTYKNIEILIVDDCSTDNTVEVARRYELLDPRIRISQQPVNGGTYRARNRALQMARGEFFTCNDSDDWAHPTRIENLILPLLTNGNLIVSMGKLFRVSSELGVKPRLGGYAQEDASSLCYRREPVVSSIGYYDSVPFGADNEFRSRLERTFGVTPFLTDKPLLISDWSRRSLSGGIELGFSDGGTRSIKRTKYRASYLESHARGELYMSYEDEPLSIQATEPEQI